MIDSLRIKKFCELTGWTETEIMECIENKEWVESKEYYYAFDHYLFISIRGYENWVNSFRKTLLAKKP